MSSPGPQPYKAQAEPKPGLRLRPFERGKDSGEQWIMKGGGAKETNSRSSEGRLVVVDGCGCVRPLRLVFEQGKGGGGERWVTKGAGAKETHSHLSAEGRVVVVDGCGCGFPPLRWMTWRRGFPLVI